MAVRKLQKLWSETKNVKAYEGPRQTSSCLEQTWTCLTKVRKRKIYSYFNISTVPKQWMSEYLKIPFIPWHFIGQQELDFNLEIPESYIESSDYQLHVNYYNHEKSTMTMPLFHPVVTARLICNNWKGGNDLFNSNSSWSLKMTAVSSRDNLLNFHESHTHKGLNTSLLPNRTVLQKDVIRTPNFLPVGSCLSGAHLEVLTATQPS